VRLPREDPLRQDYIFLGQLIGQFLDELFPGLKITGYWLFRVTRNSELYIDDEDVANLLSAVENELQNRRKGDAVRIEVSLDCPSDIRADLLNRLRLGENDIYEIDGPLNPARLMAIAEESNAPGLRHPTFVAPASAALRNGADIFAAIRQRDILLHHPYESFESVVDFLQASAKDPRVLAIKQTLYRTGGDTRIVGALMDAVKNGKQVTAVVELRARFDEANNIQWARQLEEAGVHVVYGLVGYKIHAKASLVVRRDDDQIRRYVHFATGNYNPSTARLYTDVGLFSCHPDFGEDATNLFNLITGICQFRPMRRLLVAPFDMHERLKQLIAREAENAKRGLPARIIAKINSLVDREIIEALYSASGSGVKIDLLSAAWSRACERKHLRAQHRGSLSRTQSHSLFRECLPTRRVLEQRRLDAAEFLSAHRDRVSHSRRQRSRPHRLGTTRRPAGGQHTRAVAARGRFVSHGGLGEAGKVAPQPV
jgi:polyphosphate kinase